MIRRNLLQNMMLAGVAMAAIFPVAVQAQSDVVIMRRVIAPPTRTPTPTPSTTLQPGDPGYYSWSVTAWSSTASCGTFGTETRGVTCLRADGVDAPDASCTGNGSGLKPIASRTGLVTETCGYAWRESDWSATTTTCGTEYLSRTVACVRSDGVVMGQTSLCGDSNHTPPSTEQATTTTGCSFSWATGDWSKPNTSTCKQVDETRAVYCLRSDGTRVDDSSCSGTAPNGTQSVYTCGTGIAWSIGDWSQPVPGCGNTIETRTVSCTDSDGRIYTDQVCGPKPAPTQPAKDYSTCTDGRTAANPYGWTIGSYGKPTPACGDTVDPRSVVCTDDDGNAVPDARCLMAKPDASRPDTSYASCTYAWTTGDWGAAQPGCGATVDLRTVYCQRSDGVGVDTTFCGIRNEPSATQPDTDYSACTYGWTAGQWGSPSTSCGSATETRTVACQRADGTTADDGQCDASSKPDAAQTSYETSGCGLTWNTGDWEVPPSCGTTTETRTVTCRRSDGQDVDDAQCAPIGDKPPLSQDTTDYSACTFIWATTEWSAPTTTCGSNDESRLVWCQRSDGKTIDNGPCTGAGDRPADRQSVLVTTSCTYAWAGEPWGAATPACGASTHSRTVDCRRSDGTAVDASFCSGQPNNVPTSEGTTDYSTCTYKWGADAWQGTAGCGDTVTQSRNVYCLRSNGDHVGDSLCGDPSQKPPSTQPITDYSSCSYSWAETYGTWSSTCSDTATRNNTVVCKRSNGDVVEDSNCNAATRPATTDTGNTTSCTYSYVYSDWSAPSSTCSSSATETRTATCTRSDNTPVAASLCGSQSVQSTSQNVPVYTGCTLSYTNGTFDKSLAGWTISGSVYWATNSGGSAGFNSGSGNSLSQTITGLVPGASYTVKASHVNASNTGNYTYLGYSIANASGTHNSLGGGTVTFTFTADGTSDVLKFTNSRTDQGMYLDNVIVSKN